MLAPSDLQLAGASGQSAGMPVSPRVAAFAAALSALIAATDAVAEAVRGHDHQALLAANARAEAALAEVGRRAPSVGADDRIELEWAGVPALCESLRSATRRNAHLIEHAWAVDAALIRLVAGLGRSTSEGGVGQYGNAPAPAYVDRQA